MQYGLTKCVEIVGFGMVDTSEKAYATAEKIQVANVDLIFCNMITYATSSVFAPIIREVNRPMVLVALQPLSALDYTKANTFMQLENDNICSVPEFTGLAYYYEGKEGSLHRQVTTTFIVGNSILNAQGIPMCGEYDIKTCIAMLIMDRLNIGGSFAEFHPFDFSEDFILVGHDGPHHLKIAEGKPVLRSLKKYHGKPGSGASVEFKIKEGPIPPTGNTNTRGFFAPTTKQFVKKWVMEGPTHHYALGIGHHADTIAKIAEILGIEYVIVK